MTKTELKIFIILVAIVISIAPTALLFIIANTNEWLDNDSAISIMLFVFLPQSCLAWAIITKTINNRKAFEKRADETTKSRSQCPNCGRTGNSPIKIEDLHLDDSIDVILHYRCSDCNHTFERRIPLSRGTICPSCGQGEMRKQSYSVPYGGKGDMIYYSHGEIYKCNSCGFAVLISSYSD